jgi:eukaryotic-like serine/threonine-protein kinase
MSSQPTAPRVIRFGLFELNLSAGKLRKQDRNIKLQDQPLQVLELLLSRPGEVVTREELQQALWSADTFVEFDQGLNTAIKKIRLALGDSADNPRFIETLPRKGYRFIAPVGDETPAPASAVRRRPLVLSAVVGMLLIGSGIAWFALRRAPTAEAELKQRRLTANASDNFVTGAVISPDGKYVAYGDQSGVHVKLIETGETQTIPPPANIKPGSAYWWPSAWFPDGTKLLVTAYPPGLNASLWTVSILGGTPRELRDNASVAMMSPDGSRIAFTTQRFTGNVLWSELWVMGANAEEPRKLAALDANSGFETVTWSPDSQRIGYIKTHQAPDKSEKSIESRDLKGGQPALILSDPRLEEFCWLHDGRVIYAEAEPPPNEKDNNFWQIRVDTRTGEPYDRPRRFTNWAGSELYNMTPTADGKRVAFLKQRFHSNVYVGDLQANGTRLKTPRRLSLGEYSDSPGAWTGDSKAVLFSSYRDGRWEVLKQGLDQQAAETLFTGGSENYSDLHPSADGSSVLYSVSRGNAGPTTPVNLMRLPASGGPPQLVLTARGLTDFRCGRSPATMCVLGEQSPDRKQLTFASFDPVLGRGRALTKIETDPADTYSFDLSPDGLLLAVEKANEPTGHIRILPLDGGAARDVQAKGCGALNSLNWAADGKSFFASSQSPQGAKLFHIDIEGNAQVLWAQKSGFKAWGIPSPDGKSLAILGQTFESNVWMIENF